MNYKEFSALDEVYEEGVCFPFLKHKQLKASRLVDLKYSIAAAVESLSKEARGRFEVTGAPGVGKTTKFPLQLAERLGKTAVVILPNVFLACSAYQSAVATVGKDPSLCTRTMDDRNGSGKVIYTHAGLFLKMATEGTYKNCVFIVDECLMDTAEVIAIRRMISTLANGYMTIEMSTQMGACEGILKTVIVKPVPGSNEELKKAVLGKSVLVFYSDAMTTCKAAEKAGVVAITPNSTMQDYQKAKIAIANKQMVYADISLSAGLNLDVDAVVSTTRKLALVERNGDVQTAVVTTSQLDEFQQVNRVGRFSKPGVAFSAGGGIKIDPKLLRSEIEERVGKFLFRELTGFDPDDIAQKRLRERTSGKRILNAIMKDSDWRVKIFPWVETKIDKPALDAGKKLVAKESLGNGPLVLRDPRSVLVEHRVEDKTSFIFWRSCLATRDPEGLRIGAVDYWEKINDLMKNQEGAARLVSKPGAIDKVRDMMISTRNFLLTTIFAKSFQSAEKGISSRELERIREVVVWYEKLRGFGGYPKLYYRFDKNVYVVGDGRLFPYMCNNALHWGE